MPGPFKSRFLPIFSGKTITCPITLHPRFRLVQWQRLRDLGITIFRENGGNNATKYNWRLKLSSHPDWYNNVYAHDWDFAAKSLQANIPGAQGMWAFQLIGKAAKTKTANFNDWGFNELQLVGRRWTESLRGRNMDSRAVKKPRWTGI